MKNIFIFFTLLLYINSSAQEIIGTVLVTNNGVKEGIPGANVFTIDKQYGTSTDLEGNFKLTLPKDQYKQLQISYISYKTQIVNIQNEKIEVLLEEDVQKEVVIKKKKSDRKLSSPYDIQIINSAELTKAACCNLAESFETNATIDVQFSDAVTGAKKIKMLGLDGYYTQTVFENLPAIRGLENGLGILFVPGPFMESISINKGAGSVVNGYDAITGQINYAFKKPENSERFFLNVFGSRHGQFELNSNFSHRFNDKLSTMTFIHGSIHELLHDYNNDSFQDMPLNERINILNRWRYNSKKTFKAQLGINYVYDERTSGQFKEITNFPETKKLFQSEIISRKISAFAKTGFILKKNDQSIGIQYNYSNFNQTAWIGNNHYQGLENFGRINFIFQSGMKNPYSTMKLGASYVVDDFKENFNGLDFNRTESIPGIFGEYSYQDNEKFAFVAGIRADHHNNYGFWLSPKANFKWTILPKFVMKLAGGKGFRTANVYSENLSAMVSSREFEVEENLDYESAWNIGGGLTKTFLIGFHELQLSADFYHTNFTNQVVIDYEDARKIQIYNLDGISIANSLQMEAQYEVFDGFDIKLAYKMDDIFIEYKSGLKNAPYIPQHKMLATLDYETKNEMWRFNLTGQLRGPARIPSTKSNSISNQRAELSETYLTLNTQATMKIKDFEFYLGGENITNSHQKNAIISPEDPFGTEFDGSMIWAPLDGIKVFGGMRYTLPYPTKKEHSNNNN